MQFEASALEDSFRKKGLRAHSNWGKEDEKQLGIMIANQKQYLMVLGGPGTGKSTFLRKVGLEALRTFHYDDAIYEPRLIPVLLELKRFKSHDVNIAQFITTEFETCGFPQAEAFTQNALDRGNLLVMLDGLDEIPSENLNNVLSTIQDFVDRYERNRFITSCRIAASGHHRGSAFHRFSNVTMADFDDGQVQQFITNWFGSEQDVELDTAKKCWEVLQKPENKASKELAHTPLLLTYLCLVYDLSQRFPNNRSSLYRKALRILLEEWAAEKRILRDEIEVYEGLSIEQEEILLSEIAYKGMSIDQLFFSKKEISTQIKAFLSGNLNAPRTLDSEAVLKAIEVQQGVLVERMEDQYSFSHLTLQEYLAAQYLVDNNEWHLLIQQNVTENRWREVFLLLPGLMSGKSVAGSLLMAIKKRADSYINTRRLEKLVKWAEDSIDKSETRSSLPAKRTAAIFLCRALALSRGFSRDIDRDLMLIRAIDLARTLDLELARTLDLVLIQDFNLNLDLNLALVLALAPARNFALDVSRSFNSIGVFHDVDFDALISALKHLESNKPEESANKQEKERFVESIYSLWFSAIGVESETISLSEEESKNLTNYFYICELMVRCKEGATRVSPDVWESLESGILTVPNNNKTE